MIATRPPEEVVEHVAAKDSLQIPHEEKTDAVPPEDDDPNFPSPTAEELSTLRLVPDSLSAIAFSLCLVEFAERASYYGASTVYSNFIEFPLPAGRIPL